LRWVLFWFDTLTLLILNDAFVAVFCVIHALRTTRTTANVLHVLLQIEMLFRCNLMAIVGGGNAPHAAPHRVLIWDDHVPKEIGELSFRQAVLKVKLRKDAIAVALRDRVYVYHLADLSLRDKIYTADNPYGLLSLSTHVQDMVLACPSVTTGHVRVELYGLRKTMVRSKARGVPHVRFCVESLL
jgi:hypothetical protein